LPCFQECLKALDLASFAEASIIEETAAGSQPSILQGGLCGIEKRCVISTLKG
jgi:hypothetical protein